jgi:hypothetical protein
LTGYFEDHGLPLVQLKEQRRDLVVALVGRHSVCKEQIAEIAAIQETIAAVEAVIVDLDAESHPISAKSIPRQALQREALAAPAAHRKNPPG